MFYQPSTAECIAAAVVTVAFFAFWAFLIWLGDRE